MQIMGCAMALAALRETLVHGGGVRPGAMAVLTLRDHLVLLLVTGGAFQLGVLGRALLQFFIGRGMATRAINGGYLFRVGDVLRHVGLVAGQTILLHLPSGMGRVTVGAVGNKAVPFAVAGGAGHGGVLADILLQLGHLFAMAAQAWSSDSRGYCHHPRSVRVAVAAETALQFEMGGVGMAVAAIRDDILDLGRMADMAIHTAYLLLVRSTAAGNILGRPVMTFHAITGQEFSRIRTGLHPCRRGQE